MSEWQPISSAPTKGETVLAWAGDWAFAYWARGQWYEINNGDYCEGGYGQDYRIKPTHWQPQPEPPEETGTDE